MYAVLERETAAMPVEPVLTTFEAYDGPPTDLVYAAAAWHWTDPADAVDPRRRPARARRRAGDLRQPAPARRPGASRTPSAPRSPTGSTTRRSGPKGGAVRSGLGREEIEGSGLFEDVRSTSWPGR